MFIYMLNINSNVFISINFCVNIIFDSELNSINGTHLKKNRY